MSDHITRKQVVGIIASLTGQQNVIPIPRLFIDMTGDYNRAALLNQILYWSERSSDPEGWFYKSAADWEAELGLSRYQVNRAIDGDKRRANDDEQCLSALGVVTDLRQAPNGAPTTHYRVDHDIFVKQLFEAAGIDGSIFNNVEHPSSTMSQMDVKQCRNSSYTETTTETTTENSVAPDSATPPPDENPALQGEPETSSDDTPQGETPGERKKREVALLVEHYDVDPDAWVTQNNLRAAFFGSVNVKGDYSKLNLNMSEEEFIAFAKWELSNARDAGISKVLSPAAIERHVNAWRNSREQWKPIRDRRPDEIEWNWINEEGNA